MNTKQKVILQIMCKFQVNALDSLILNSGLDNLISKSRSRHYHVFAGRFEELEFIFLHDNKKYANYQKKISSVEVRKRHLKKISLQCLVIKGVKICSEIMTP